MCLTYCHRLKVLYWNHDSCSFEFCPLTAEAPGRCKSCRHRQAAGEICGLTRAPLPQAGGCCHWNVDLVTGPQPVTLAMLAPLGFAGFETVAEVLAGLDASYEVDAAGRPWVDPDRLSLPETYGLGTEAMPPELLDWSGWEETWRERD